MTITNNNAATEYGTKAATAWASADKSGEAGDANAIMAFYLAHRTMTFTATVERKKEDIIQSIDFDMDDWQSPLFNSDGSKDTRAMAARTAAVALRIFGVKAEDITNAMRVRIDRTRKFAAYLAGRHNVMDDDAYNGAVTLKANKLVVPYGACKPEPKLDASDNDKLVFEAMKDKPLTLDGKNGASLAELGKRANPPKAKRDQAPASEGNALVSSVDFLTALMLQINGSDECDVALSDDVRGKLYKLQAGIAAYFETDPIEDEVEEHIAA